MQFIDELRPYSVIGSPPCTAWSNLQSLNEYRLGVVHQVEEAQQSARIHLDFSAEVCRAQMRAGRYFVHQHPQSASSWHVECMCAFGTKLTDAEGEGPVLKPTVFMTNIMEICKELSQKCPGCARHVHLVEGRASAAHLYPPALCRASGTGTSSSCIIYKILSQGKCLPLPFPPV